MLQSLEEFRLKHPLIAFGITWAALFVLCIAVRLPHFLSRNFYFDGDEAIVGIMAQDWTQLKAFPTFFYGQNYGFCVFEVWSVAFWLKILGTGIWALRLGGLTLFSLGIVLLVFGSLRRNLKPQVVLLFAVMVCTFPSWYLWGSMVRGGYVMAFFCVSMIYYLLSLKNLNSKNLMLIGFFCACAFESHVLILFPVLPLFLKDWLELNGKFKKLILLFIFFATSIVLIKISDHYYNGWDAPKLLFHDNTLRHIFQLNINNIIEIFGGFYFYNAFLAVPNWWYFGLSILLITYLIFLFLIFPRSNKGIGLLWLMAMLFVFAITGFFSVYSPRYLLGFFMGMLFFVLYFYSNSRLQKGLFFSILFLQLMGIMAGSKHKREWYDNSQNQLEALQTVHDTVVKNHKKAILVSDNLGQWQWNYLYGHEIPAAAFRRVERVMRFSKSCYKVYDQNPKDLAFIGLWGVFWSMDSLEGFNSNRIQVAEKFYYMGNVQARYVKKAESVAQ